MTWSAQLLGSHPMNLRVREIPRSLPSVLLEWMAVIFSRLRHSRSRRTSFSEPRCLNPRQRGSRDTCPPSNEWLRFFRSFETLGTKVSTSYPPICRNGEILTRRQHGSHDGTFRLFGVLGLRDFANPDSKPSSLQPTKPRNTEFRCTSPINGPHKPFRPFGTSPFATSRISRQGFQFSNSQNPEMRFRE
jgi:hypothetical protein